MNYEKMSDEYINTEVLRVLYGDVVDYWSLSDCGAYLYDCMPVGDAFYKIELKDYCNNPADAWPLIAENRINIDFQYGEWPTAEYDEYIYTDKNPLRAAMIVFLMMQDHKEMEIMQSDYKVRVVQEAKELAEKTASLHNFIGGDVFESLPAREQGLLMVQHEAMKMYHNALIERIKLF